MTYRWNTNIPKAENGGILFFLIHHRLSSTRAAFSRSVSRPSSCLLQREWTDQTRVQCEGAFGKHRPSLWLKAAESRHCSADSYKNISDSSSSPLCTQCSDRSLPPSPESLMRRHFFFCTSCSSFRAAVFFDSTLSRLFRSSTQALMSCRNDDKNLELKPNQGWGERTVNFTGASAGLHHVCTFFKLNLLIPEDDFYSEIIVLCQNKNILLGPYSNVWDWLFCTKFLFWNDVTDRTDGSGSQRKLKQRFKFMNNVGKSTLFEKIVALLYLTAQFSLGALIPDTSTKLE